jgi:hypothetical protein
VLSDRPATLPSTPAPVEPQDLSPAQIQVDLEWLRSFRFCLACVQTPCVCTDEQLDLRRERELFEPDLGDDERELWGGDEW